MATVPNPLLVQAYARGIYSFGNKTFAQIAAGYEEAVKKYAATNFTTAEVDNALVAGYITEQQYQETNAYVQTNN